jgi:1-deoxy-D-xylulose-5-phosphate reductoisomerase
MVRADGSCPRRSVRGRLKNSVMADSRPTTSRTGLRRVIVLGSTGSVGRQTLEVIEHLESGGASLKVVGLAAGANSDLLLSQARRLGVEHTALARGDAPGVSFCGMDAAEQLVRSVEADLVVASIVGAAGLGATLAAIELGRDVALANKEALVAAGKLVVPLAREQSVRLLPVDSEHAALWLCLGCVDSGCCPPCVVPEVVEKVVLTASGGPFREWNQDRLHTARASDALAHPTWSMGRKITIDSATLMNKAFELIEAHWLFGLEPERMGVVIHPQSVVHAMIELRDGSVMAQMGDPDMRTPIQQALMSPGRPGGVSRKLDLESIGSLSFEKADAARFPALDLWREVIKAGGTAGAVVAGANELAVEAFLEDRIGFCEIEALAREALGVVGVSRIRELADVTEADGEARRFVASKIGAGSLGGGFDG